MVHMRWTMFFTVSALATFLLGFGDQISIPQNESHYIHFGEDLVIDSKEYHMPGAPGIPGSSLFKPPNAERDYWPTKEWRTKTFAEVGLDPASIQNMEQYAFTRSSPESERQGIRTDGVVIIKDGYLVYEKYASEYNAEKRHLIWSASKSVTNAIFGVAVKDGFVRLDDPAYLDYSPLNREETHTITINHLLRMSSGLYSNEMYESSPLDSTVNAMLFSTGHQDMGAYAALQPVIAPPDTHWEYSSLTSTLLMAILKNKMEPRIYDAYPWKGLFDPIGMKSAVFEMDVSSTFVGSSYVHLTPRDMARFGFLFLNDGVWDGEQILAEDWVRYSTTVAPAMQTTKLTVDDLSEGTYGAQWWLNRSAPEWGIPIAFPDAPEDLFYASGHWGQAIFVIPSMDMVIAYTADNRDDSMDYNHFLKLILEGISDGRDS